MELIAGDIGGTKSRLAWVTGSTAAEAQLCFEREYVSSGFGTANDLVRQFMGDAGRADPPDTLLLALPGPVQAQQVSLTNLDWTLSAADMSASLGVAHVRFINDFQAAAAGVATLESGDVVALNACPAEPQGLRAITGAGTGLGLAFMLVDEAGGSLNFASEGGHVDFAPANAMQDRLLQSLRAIHGHVSWERVVSGSALDDLYYFCCIEHGLIPPSDPVTGPAIGELAASGDVVAEATLDLFIDLYGAWAGNIALLLQPRGGLYIAGGVAGHLQARMQSPRFMTAATDKGRMREVVERTPIYLVINPRLGVQGAIATALTPP